VWEKPKNTDRARLKNRGERVKFLIGGLLILGVVVYLIISGTVSGARYFITVDNLMSNPQYVGQTVRISGAVLGDSIQYDAEKLLIQFTIANVPEKFDNLAVALTAVRARTTHLNVVVESVKPDLSSTAQAI
jgi:cytochrome c-type biogenesis protein CcmE